MNSEEVRKKFLDFFEMKGHKIVPSASLVPEGDPSVLFTTAGMQQFKPYYTAPQNAMTDFGTKNVVSIQKCVRTGDIDEVGDDTHLTFFEMLGNFSFGGYFKKEAIEYAYEFITKELDLKIDYVSIFEGDDKVSADTESENIWKSIDPSIEIRRAGKEDNFWGPTGDEGPCGPTTEIYINGVEIWNIVFNEYFQSHDGTLKKLEVPGVDTGMGLERLLVQIQKKNNVYETDLLSSIIDLVQDTETEKDKRRVADHTKSSVFMISDGVKPSNTKEGYVLRRLIRQTVHPYVSRSNIVNEIVNIYKDTYPELETNKEMIIKEIEKEEDKTNDAYNTALKYFKKGIDPFILHTTYGLPFNIVKVLAARNGVVVDEEDFNKKYIEHQKLSKTASTRMFKGGLANTNEQTIKLHTAHHLLLSALQEVLGKEVKQRGSNITEERLRMDFSFSRKLTDVEIKKVEEIVNKHIRDDHKVIRKEMPRVEAETLGAEMEFGAKYPETVSIYFIEDKKGNIISKEFCGGPHVEHTSELGRFRILKEEASSAGVRRIKAVLE